MMLGGKKVWIPVWFWLERNDGTRGGGRVYDEVNLFSENRDCGKNNRDNL